MNSVDPISVPSATKIMSMYRYISDDLIEYLKGKDMKDPHPAKEFIMKLLQMALNIEMASTYSDGFGDLNTIM